MTNTKLKYDFHETPFSIISQFVVGIISVDKTKLGMHSGIKQAVNNNK
jgi:hypothetical protein